MDLNEFIDFYSKKSEILLQINKLIKNFKNLNCFTKIKLEFFLKLEKSDEVIFKQLLSAKVAAQTNLNILYNSHFYKKCSVLNSYLPYAGKENVKKEEVAILILRYIILYQHLSQKETKTTRDDILEERMILDPRAVQCSYCDTYNTLDKTKCEGCDDDLCVIRERINNEEKVRINNEEKERINNDDRGRINNDDRGRINNDDRGRINNDDRGRISNEDRGRINNDDRGRINNDDRERISNDDRGRINNDDRGRISNEDRGRINNDDRERISNDDRGRINNDDRGRINNDDRGRINNDDRGRINNDDRERINNEDMWICRHCTCNNSASIMCCIACERDKVEGSLIKDDNVKKGRKRKKNQSYSTNTRDLSKLIPEDVTLDAKINYPKIKNDRNVEQSINKWSCTFCTFINEFTDINCVACNNKRIYFNNTEEIKLEQNKDKNQGFRSDINKEKDNINQINVNRSINYNTSKVLSQRGASITSERSDDRSFNNTSKVDNDIVKSEGGTWACPSCTFNNKLQNLCCEVCFTFKEVKVSSEDSDNEGCGDEESSVKGEDGLKGTWQCIHCKEVNLYDKYTCGSCQKYAAFFKKWVCERCSFFNDELSEYCKVCNEKNVNLKKCSKCKKMTKVSEGALCKGCKDNTSESNETIKEDDWIKVENKRKGNKVKEEFSDVSMKGKYYCNNRRCGNINNNNLKHCSKCKLKKEANITFFNTVDVFNGNTYIKMWQCTFCGDLNTKASCGKCKNLRHSSSYKKCSQCNWVNKSIDRKCNKCFKILSSLK